MKRNDFLDSSDLLCQGTIGHQYEKTDAKIIAFDAQLKTEHGKSKNKIWYEQRIALPFECEKQLCTLEQHAPGGFSLAHRGEYREIQFEFVQYQSPNDFNDLQASFDDLNLK